jgi:hypothetical protein
VYDVWEITDIFRRISLQQGKNSMSVEERCQQFLQQARIMQTLNPKEISTLRRFLVRNQHQRLGSGAQQAICDTIVLYACAKHSDPELVIPLLEDALAMPFSILGTSHKKALLRHLDRIRGEVDSKQQSNNSEKIETEELEAIGVSDEQNQVQVMNVDGDTFWVDAGASFCSQITELLDQPENGQVIVRVENGRLVEIVSESL